MRSRDNLKIAIIGLNGIGTYFVRSLSELIKKDVSGLDRINPMAIDLYDYDTIEEKNFSYTIYDIEHLGRNKAEVLAEITGYKAVAEKIEKPEQLAGYDFIILCVDNNMTRQLVYNSGLPFLDLRANGKSIFASLTSKELDVDKKYIDLTPENALKGSCQREEDLEDKHIQAGNLIVASVGIQFLLDYLRGETKQKDLIQYI